MVTSDVGVQTAVHSLDQGRLGTVIKMAMFGALIVCLSLLYLFVQFRGLSTAGAMDQAQIARRLADGKGFTTGYVRPLALHIIQQRTGQDQTDVSAFPDFSESPLHPWVNSFALRLIKDRSKMERSEVVYTGDRIVASVSVLFFLLSVAVGYFILGRLFDRRLALFGCASVLLTDLMWQFSISALPQTLVLFLFSLAVLFTLRAIDAWERGFGPTVGWLAGAGICMGLMTLAHGLSAWLFVGWLVFAFAFFRGRRIGAAVALAAYLLIVAPWLVRNFQLCGNPFGLAAYQAFFNSSPEESFLRESEVSTENSGTSLQGKARVRIAQQIEMIFGYLGMNVAAGAFFLALLHPFRNRKTQAFKWCVLLMWVFAVLGMALYHPTGVVSENQFHVVFIPIFIGYGMAFLFVLWNRIDLRIALLRKAFAFGLLLVCAVPMLLTLLGGQKNPIHWPPYVPSYIALLRDWFQEDEIICSDMPWAVAWYAQRSSLLLPATVRAFNTIHDYQRTAQPVRGLYLTPLTGNQPLFAGIYAGPYKDWAPLIMRPPRVRGFPLPVFVTLPIEGRCILFSDRPRWNQPKAAVP